MIELPAKLINMEDMLLCLLSAALLFCFSGVEAGSTCTTDQRVQYANDWWSYYDGQYTYKYTYTFCEWNCCGSWPHQYCCNRFSTGLIVGIIFGACALICVVVSLVCCCIKKTGHSGRVVSPANNHQPHGNNLTMVYTGASGQYPVVHHAWSGYSTVPCPAQPPEYKPHDAPPPAYTYNDPAYPPGAGPSSASAPPPPPYAPPTPAVEAPEMWASGRASEMGRGPSTAGGGRSGESGSLDAPVRSSASGVGPLNTALPYRQ